MATSGVDTFSLTRDTAITLALRKLNVLELGVTPDSTTLTQANQNLNIMLKAWQTDGLKLWTVNELIIPYTAGKTVYTIGESGADIINPRPLKVVYAFLRNNTTPTPIDIPMTIMAKTDYLMLGGKFSQGVTNTIFYDPLIPNGSLSVYLTPDTATVTNYTLHLIYQRQIQDMVSSTDNFDLPQEWSQAIVWCLAAELCEEYDVPESKIQRITMRADKYKNDLIDWDVEHASTFFQPDYRAQYQKGIQ